MSGKLHIPGPSGTATACARQLNNHRDTRAQLADKVTIAATAEEYISALRDGKACRHCGRAAKLLPKITRAPTRHEGENDSDE